jgi:hypothetical protein
VSTFDLRTPISTGRVVPGREAATGHADDLAGMVRRNWPDLPVGDPVIMLPREDFDIIVAATHGRPILQTRGIVEFVLAAPARQAPPWLADATDIAAKTFWIVYGVVIVGLVTGVWR